MYFQLLFALERVEALAPQHPEWKDTEPFASLLKGDLEGRDGGRHEIGGRDRHGHARRHDHHAVRGDRQGLDRDGTTSHERAALHRDGLSADAGAARLSARQRLQDLHRLRRRHRVHAPWAEQVYGIPPEQVIGSSIKVEVRDARRQAGACPPARDRLLRRQGRQAGGDPPADRPAAASPRSATPTATCRCCSGPRPETGRDLPSMSTTPTASASGPTTARPAWAVLDKGLDEAQAQGWTLVDMKQDWKVIYPDQK